MECFCIDCPPNYHQFVSESTTSCVPCERGTYSNEDGQVTCIVCPEHMSTLNIGASDVEDCIDQCPPGYNSTTGLVPCEPCAEYYYQLDYGAMTCTLCTERNAFNITECASESAVPSVSPSEKLDTSNTGLTKISWGSLASALFAGIVVVLMVFVLILIVKRKKSPKDADEIVRRHSNKNHRLPSRSDQFLNPMHNKNVRNTEYTHQSSLYNDFEGEVSKVNPLFNEDDDWSQFDSTNSYAVVESTINNGGKTIEDDSSSISSMDEYEVPVDDDLPLTKYN